MKVLVCFWRLGWVEVRCFVAGGEEVKAKEEEVRGGEGEGGEGVDVFLPVDWFKEQQHIAVVTPPSGLAPCQCPEPYHRPPPRAPRLTVLHMHPFRAGVLCWMNGVSLMCDGD